MFCGRVFYGDIRSLLIPVVRCLPGDLMNMKAMLGAIVALLLAVGGTAFLAARVATPKPLPPEPVPAAIADQLKSNPFDLLARREARTASPFSVE